jgi:RsiW-degrading membrane proteinase PrsW (M82 family)
LYVIYRSDRFDPEPTALVFRTFLIGAVLGIGFGLGYRGLPFVRDMVIAAVVVAPIVEELAKFLVVRWSVYERPEFNEPIDGVVYACSAALGFGAVENVAYVLDAWYNIMPGAGILVLLGRAVLSVPGHALFSSMWGAALGWYACSAPKSAKGKKKGRKAGKKTGEWRRSPLIIVVGLIAAMVFHSLFNLLAQYEPLGGLGLLILMAAMWRFLYRAVIGKSLSASPFASKKQR